MTVAELTTDAIDAMPAGREMDVEIHRRIFDLRVEWHDDEPYVPNREEKFFGIIPIPHYSTDIAAAFEMIEKMQAKGYTLELYSPGALINDEFSTHSVGWGVEFYAWDKPGLRGGRVGATASHLMDRKDGVPVETAPLAICRAALKSCH